jgi:hypothetical protein
MPLSSSTTASPPRVAAFNPDEIMEKAINRPTPHRRRTIADAIDQFFRSDSHEDVAAARMQSRGEAGR